MKGDFPRGIGNPHKILDTTPIIIPTPKQKKNFENIFEEAYEVKERLFDGKLSQEVAESKLDEIQKNLDSEVLKLYKLT